MRCGVCVLWAASQSICAYVVQGDTEREAKDYFDDYVNQKGDWEAADNICKVFGVESGSYSPDYMDKFRRNFIAGWGGYPLVGTCEVANRKICFVTAASEAAQV